MADHVITCGCSGERARLGNWLDEMEIVHRIEPSLTYRAASLLQTGHVPDCPIILTTRATTA